MMKPNSDALVPFLLTAALLLGQLQLSHADDAPISLAGIWKFQLDAKNVGVGEKWFAKELEDSVRLPGTTDENHKGIPQEEKPTDRLARVWFWKGPAWYQKEVDIPSFRAGKRITLFLERTKNSRVWVDGVFCGREDSLSAPHVFDITKAAKPGRHTITVLIDNSKLPPVGPAHQVDERTQTNWNGIVGTMEIRATDPVWIEDVQVYPDVANKTAKVRAVIGNITGKPAKGKITIRCTGDNVTSPAEFQSQTVELNAPERKNAIEFVYVPGGEVPLWDEFQPALMKLVLKLDATAGDASFTDRQTRRFGMREFTRDGSRLLVNGKPVFLRGRLDCANYPLTGYAPMDQAEWRRIYTILKDWGLNHVRFHSWCPPQAAFEAADELGFYLQPELPNKRSAFNASDSKDAAYHNIDFLEGEDMDESIPLYDYGKREGELILRHFGNHPSFDMFTLGNELGRNEGMFELVNHFKKTDPRHLYAQGSNNMHWNPSVAEGDQFWVTGKVGNDRPIRGSFYLHDFPKAPIEFHPPSTLDDFRESIKDVPVPLIGHETGQYQVYPDFDDIPKFTGVLKARNYEIFRERLEKAGMRDQAPDFVRASAALAEICYREDMELALRTPGFGGFQLLDIMDFPGQGTALVGMLNVFMQPKPGVSIGDWRKSCGPVVPLLRMEKFAWTTDETITGRVQVAQYGPADIPDARVSWILTNSAGSPVDQGSLAPITLVKGGLADVGMFTKALGDIAAPQRLNLILTIAGTPYHNSYPLWIYPPKVETTAPGGVIISRSLADDRTNTHLSMGGKVLLLPKLDQLPHSVLGGFQTEFWSPMFAQSARKRGLQEPPGTLGFLCDPGHPALAGFPTEFHSNWQWWHLVKNSRPLILDETTRDYRPIVQVIDNFDRNHKLGLLMETKAGKGALLVCAIDLLGNQDKPEARQLMHSLLEYMGSPAFSPKAALDTQLLRKLLPE